MSSKKILNSKQNQVAMLQAKGVPILEAYAQSGYNPDVKTLNIEDSGPMSRAIERHMRRILTDEAAPEALAVLREIAVDKQVHAATRRAAARDILDRAGYAPPKSVERAPVDASIAAMSADELAALVDRMEQELASRARPINAPDTPATPAEAIDTVG